MSHIQCEEVAAYQVAEQLRKQEVVDDIIRIVNKEPVVKDIGSVAIQTAYVAVGKVHKDKVVTQIRINDCEWRAPKDDDFNALLFWLMNNGFDRIGQAVPVARSGSQTAKYFFGKCRMGTMKGDAGTQEDRCYGK